MINDKQIRSFFTVLGSLLVFIGLVLAMEFSQGKSFLNILSGGQLVAAAADKLQPTPTGAKMVFGNYMLAYPTYGEAVDTLKREIQEAQALGIDGFVLNAGGWSNPAVSYYQTRTANMFAAAKQFGTNFKLVFSADLCCGLTAAEIQEMMTTYAKHPNYFTYNSQPVLTTFIGQDLGQTFWQNLLKQLTSVLFVPNFATINGNWLDPANVNFNGASYTQISSDYNSWWKNVVHGLAYFSVGAMPQNLAATGEAYAQLIRENSKIYFAATSPYFWEGRLSSGEPYLLRRYYEYFGGEGIAAQWNSIINVQKPMWVQLVTWNDYAESYMSPADPAQMPYKQYFYNVGPLLKSHAGYAELEKYFIQWFKTGAQPAVTNDALYFFYRTHPKDLQVPNDTQNIVQYGTLDDIYVTTNLTAPATLKVTTGGVAKTFDVPAGMTHTRVPFNTGAQSFDLVRSGTTVVHLDGDPIDATITAYNFSTTSGFGYSK